MSEVGVRGLLEHRIANRYSDLQQQQSQNDIWSDVRFPEVTFGMVRHPFGLVVLLMVAAVLVEPFRLIGRVDWGRKFRRMRARYRYFVAYLQVRYENIRYALCIRRMRLYY